MIHLIYVSNAAQAMNDERLLEMLTQARARNKRQQVTGMLLYANGNFLQVLEGAAADVDEIYQAITQDDRNNGNIIVQRKAIEKRSFADWSMAFKSLSHKQIAETEGYSEFLVKKVSAEHLVKNAVGIAALLESFKVSLR